MINYVKHYRKHLEGMLSYMNTRGTGSYGTDPSRVYTYNGQTYYDRATICHPKVLAKQTKRFRSGPPQLVLPVAPRRTEVSAAQGQDGSHDQDPLQGRRLLHGLQLRQEDEALSAQHAVGSARAGRRHPGVDRQRAGDQGEAALRQDLPRAAATTSRCTTSSRAKGTFYYFNRGRYVTGTWSKGKVDEPFTFTLADGSPFKMAPGQTFVELPDTKAKLRIKD